MPERFVQSYAETMSGNAPLSIVAACFVSNDYKEGRKAFKENRKPVWTGR